MLLSISASADYDLVVETFLLLMVEPRLQGDAHLVKRESLRTTPTPFSRLDIDMYGNPVRRFLAPKGFFCFDFNALVEVTPNVAIPRGALETPPQSLPLDVVTFTFPSRYCASDRLIDFATSEFGSVKPGAARVNAVAEWVNRKIRYQYGVSNASSGVEETIIRRAGVCRDFAHLTVAICRALGMPARYVSGYCLGLEPPDFHAWAQVYLNNSWHNVDATFSGVRPALVPIAFGRDAADVSLLTLWKSAQVREQSVSVREVSEEEIVGNEIDSEL